VLSFEDKNLDQKHVGIQDFYHKTGKRIP